MESRSEDKLRERNCSQIDEILKHKWIESEKAGYDIGELQAALDWVQKYAASYGQEHLD